MFDSFIEELPNTIKEFQQKLKNYFPQLYDTKVFNITLLIFKITDFMKFDKINSIY